VDKVEGLTQTLRYSDSLSSVKPEEKENTALGNVIGK